MDTSGLPARELGIGEVVKRSFNIYRAKLLLFVLPPLVVIISSIALTTIISDPIASNFQQIMNGYLHIPNNPTTLPINYSLLTVAVVISIVFSLLQFFFYGYSIVLTKKVITGGETRFSEIVSETYSKYWKGLGAALILVTVGAVAFLLPFSIMVTSFISDNWALAIIFTLTLFVVFFGYAYFALRIPFFIQAIYVEGRGSVDSLKRSMQLSKGRYWMSFACLLVVGLIAEIPSFVVSFTNFAYAFNNSGASTLFISSVVNSVVSTVMYPFVIIGYTIWFYSLKARFEVPPITPPPPTL